jgi:hypothetical protein
MANGCPWWLTQFPLTNFAMIEGGKPANYTKPLIPEKGFKAFTFQKN